VTRIAPALAVLAGLLCALPAAADVPPPPNSPDAHCSLQEQCAHGVLCPYSFNPGRPQPPGEAPLGEACRSQATSKGLEQRCRHGNLYRGDDLFCPKGETGSWKPDAPPVDTTATAAPTPSASAPPSVPTPRPIASDATTSAPPPAASRCAAGPGNAAGGRALAFAAALAALALRARRTRSRSAG
jgi:hypothetical protein